MDVAVASNTRLSPKSDDTEVVDVLREVARRYDVTRYDIAGSSHKRAHAWARQVAMYVVYRWKKPIGWGYDQVGLSVAGRHHTTVLYAVRKIQKMMDRDPAFAAEIDDIFFELEIKNPAQ